MKIPRGLLVVIATMAVAAALGAVAAFIPAVQRWAVRAAVGGRPGLQFEVERLNAWTGSIAVRDLRFEQPGTHVVLAAAAADISLWETFAHRRVAVRAGSVKGLMVDLTGLIGSPAQGGGTITHPAAPGGAPAPAMVSAATAPIGRAPAFDGLFKYLLPPVRVVLDTHSNEVEVVFPLAPGRAPGRLRLKLTDGRLGPGEVARFDLEAVMENDHSAALIDRVETRGTVAAAFDSALALATVEAHLEAVATGPRVPAPARLQADVKLARTAAGETYALTLNSLEGGVVSRVLGVNIGYASAAAKLTGSWQVQASKRQVAPFVLGMALPEFTAAGEGRFEVDAVTRDVHLAGRLAGDFDQLEAVDPRLREFGRLSTAATFDLDYGRGRVQVSELVAKVGGRAPVLSLQSIQPFSVELASHQLAAANPVKELLEVSIEGLPLAWVRPFLSAFAVEGGELKGGFVASLHAGRVSLRTTSPLAVRGLAVSRAGRLLLPASDVSVEAEVEHSKEETRIKVGKLGLETAANDWINARGEVSLRSGASPSIALQASFEAILPTLLETCAPIGPVEAHGAVTCSLAGGAVQVDRLDAHVSRPEGRVLLELSSDEAFRFNLAEWSFVTLSGRSGEVLRVKVGRVPLRVLRPYLGSLDLGGDIMPADLTVRTQGETLHGATEAGVRVESFSAAIAGRPLVRDLAIELEPVIDFTSQGVTARLAALRASDAADTLLLSGEAEADLWPDLVRPKLRAAATFELSVPALAGQPLLGGRAPPAQGKMSGEAKFTYDRDLLGEGRLTLNGLVSPTHHEALPIVNMSFRAGWGEKGEVAVQVPLLIDRSGERSDLTLAATLRPANDGRSLDAKITGQHFVVDDLLELVRAFTAPAASAPASPAGPRTPKPEDGSPEASGQTAAAEPTPPPPAAIAIPAAPWAGLTGRVALDVKSLVYGRAIEISGLSGRLSIDPHRLAAEKIGGTLGTDGQLLLDAEVRFAPGEPEPYSSKFDLDVRDFEVGPWFKAIAPGKPPTVEGRFNIRSQAAGTGRTLGELIDHTHGEFVLQSRKGVFRGLQQEAAAVSLAARLLGSIGEKVENFATRADVTAEIAGQLAQLPFDQLNVRLARDESLNLKLTDFVLVSPNVRLQGDGHVTYDPAKSLLNQTMQVRINMGVMGAVENKIARAKLPVLSGERDDLGYMKLREPFVIGGTLSKPNASQLYVMLTRSLLDLILP